MKSLAAGSPLRCPKERIDELLISAREFDRIFNDDAEEDSTSGDDETHIDTECGDDDIELADLDGNRMDVQG
jgi:hypothetical protein